MDKYELVIENCTNAYILDKEENKIVALCSTKRPDLGFEKLQQLIQDANNFIPIKSEIEESKESFKKSIDELKNCKENNPLIYNHIINNVLISPEEKKRRRIKQLFETLEVEWRLKLIKIREPLIRFPKEEKWQFRISIYC